MNENNPETINHMRWTGHVGSTGDKKFPKKLFYGELKTRKRPQYKPRNRFKYNLNNNLNALICTEWRYLIRDGYNDLRVKHSGMLK